MKSKFLEPPGIILFSFADLLVFSDEGQNQSQNSKEENLKGATTYSRELYAAELQSVSTSGQDWKGDPEISPWQAQYDSALAWYVVPQSKY